jgi:hypothetical protein
MSSIRPFGSADAGGVPASLPPAGPGSRVAGTTIISQGSFSVFMTLVGQADRDRNNIGRERGRNSTASAPNTGRRLGTGESRAGAVPRMAPRARNRGRPPDRPFAAGLRGACGRSNHEGRQ